MLVKDIMTTGVITISPFASLREAMQKMRESGVKALIVERMDPHDAWGILTYTNILRTIVAEEGDIDLINVYDVSIKPVISVNREMDVRHVAKLMLNHSVRRLVVLHNDELVGLVTRNNIVRPVLEMAGE